MGNPAFSLPVLQSLHSCWGDPVGVYTAPDRRRGRGLRKGYSEIKAYSIEKGWPVYQPSSLNCPKSTQHFRDLAPEIVVVAAYGLLIPSEMLDVPRHGFINIHPSLLPHYRGPSPVPSAILDGVDETGVSLMLLDRGWDTGPVLAQESTKILPGERADALTRRLFQMGAQLLTEHAPLLGGPPYFPPTPGPDPGHPYGQADEGRRPGRLAGEFGYPLPPLPCLHPVARAIHPLARQAAPPARRRRIFPISNHRSPRSAGGIGILSGQKNSGNGQGPAGAAGRARDPIRRGHSSAGPPATNRRTPTPSRLGVPARLSPYSRRAAGRLTGRSDGRC